MDKKDLLNLLRDMFGQYEVGWYNQDKNLMAQEMGRQQGGTFYPHLVDRYNPNKVRFINDMSTPDEYQRVKIPKGSEITDNGRWYRVPPKDIRPYPVNSLADKLKWLGYVGMGTKSLGPALLFGLATKPLPAGEDPDWVPPQYPSLQDDKLYGYINNEDE